ncbi:hypothetical protein [Allocoleopsis sp.]|uniref:hypothetical protein n=1 Tax=Allocoleopsis sp. TaxID=3088169 RepID=UPI002FD78D2E
MQQHIASDSDRPQEVAIAQSIKSKFTMGKPVCSKLCSGLLSVSSMHGSFSSRIY